jgi:hypothetical protein
MPQKKFLVTLTADERQHLAGLLAAGKRSALTRLLQVLTPVGSG